MRNGFIKGIRFYKGYHNTGTHVGQLWSNTGTSLATADLHGRVRLRLAAGDVHQPGGCDGRHDLRGVLLRAVRAVRVRRLVLHEPATRDPGPLATLANGVGGANGVYRYGGGFPTSTYAPANYWVDIGVETTTARTGRHRRWSPRRRPRRRRRSPPRSPTGQGPVQRGGLQLVGRASASRRRRARPWPVRRRTTPRRRPRQFTADGPAGLLHHVQRDRDRRPGRGRQRDGPVGLDLPHRDPTRRRTGRSDRVITNTAHPYSYYYAEILRTEGFNAFSTSSLGRVDRVDARALDVAILGDIPLTDTQAADAHHVGRRRRRADRDEPGREAGHVAGPHPGRQDAGQRVPQGRDRGDGARGRASPRPRCSSTAPPIATPLRRHSGRHALQLGHRGGEQPGRDDAHRRLVRRAGGGVHLRPGEVGRADPAGQPGLGGQERDGYGTGPIRRHVLRRRVHAGLDRPVQGGHSAGRRAAAVAGQPDPAPQRSIASRCPGSGTSRAGRTRSWCRPATTRSPARTARRPVRPVPRQQRARLPHRRLAVPAVHHVPVAVGGLHRRAGAGVPRAGLRGRAAPGERVHELHPGEPGDHLREPARGVGGEVPEPCPRRPTSRYHCIAYSDWDSQPKTEFRHGIRLRHQLLLLARIVDPGPARVHDRFGHADAVHRRQRPDDRRLPGADGDVNESGQTYPFTSNQLLDRALGPEGYYGVFVANMHNSNEPTSYEDD